MSEVIAKAMNSTLGTEHFVGFDRLMFRKGVKASDTELWSDNLGETIVEVKDTIGEGESVYEVAYSAVIGNLSGRVNISIPDILVHRNSYSGSGLALESIAGRVHLYVNDILYASTDTAYASNDANREACDSRLQVSFANVKVQAGDVIKIMLEARRGVNARVCTGYVSTDNKTISIKGTLADYIDIERV